MNVRPIIVFLLVLSLTACSASRKELDTNPAFAPHSFRDFAVSITWQSERKGQEVQVSGTITNLRYAFMRDLELKARLLDETGNAIARVTYLDFPTYIPEGKTATFHLSFQVPPGFVPARLRFGYIYWLKEEPPVLKGYEGYEDIPHYGNFDAPM